MAVVTDGSAVLGLGNIGPYAALPVMEGKAALFKRFAGIDAWPICLDTQDTDEIVATVAAIAPGFGGINLEDISAPRCFEVERRLRAMLDIPVFHDDQHGTAIVVLAALTNALRVVGKELADVKIVMAGAGAAGTAVLKLLLNAGARNVISCDIEGAVYRGRPGINESLQLDRRAHQRRGYAGDLKGAVVGADVFIGVSAPNVLAGEDVKTMAPARSCSRSPIPTRRSTRTRRASTPRSWRPGAATTRTRSTTCWRSPACSAACSTRSPPRSPTTMLVAAARALADVVRPRSSAPTTSSRRCSTLTSPPGWPPRSGRPARRETRPVQLGHADATGRSVVTWMAWVRIRRLADSWSRLRCWGIRISAARWC